jgi:tetratricopeptide (TPR) repeat protein
MVQNDIAREVSQRLRSQLSAADQQRMASGSTANPDAYQLFLKGSYYTDKFTQAGFSKGIDYLNQAIALDPGYAQAYSELAYNYINQDDWFIPPADSAPKARAAAQKALSLEETDVEAHVVLAIEYDWYEWDWTAADREFRRAIELDPDNGEARGYYSWFLPSMGRNDEAVDQARQMQRMYPTSTGGNANLGSEARKVLERLGVLSRERYVAPYNIALVQAGLGDKDAAFAWLERAYDARSYILAVYLNTDARLQSLYGDPRYESLLHRMKLSAPK